MNRRPAFLSLQEMADCAGRFAGWSLGGRSRQGARRSEGIRGLQGRAAFKDVSGDRGETAAHRFKLGCFPSLQRQCSARRDLAGNGFSHYNWEKFPKCGSKAAIPRQMTAQLLSARKRLQDAEIGVAFCAQSHSGAKRQPIGSSWGIFRHCKGSAVQRAIWREWLFSL